MLGNAEAVVSCKLKCILLLWAMINKAWPGQNPALTLRMPPTVSPSFFWGSNECVSFVRESVCVRGLINVESNAARDTHTP